MAARPSAQARDKIWAVYKEQFENNLLPLCGAGEPTNGTSGTGANARGQGGRGCRYTDTLNGEDYINIGTHASPHWDMVSSAVTTSSG